MAYIQCYMLFLLSLENYFHFTVLSPSQIEHQIEMNEEEDRYWMDNDDSDDDCDDNVDFTCNFCELSPRGSHALNCPNNDSPFAQLVRDGYD